MSIKIDEINDPGSCLNRAQLNERIFVLLARDAAAPAAIHAWCEARISLGKNKPDDPEIVSARECAYAMERERDPMRAQLGK